MEATTARSSGSSTDLGTPEIHKRKSVMIEGGSLPRARVMDQSAFDTLLLKGKITLAQHQAAEYFLEQASRANVFVKSVNFEGASTAGNPSRDHYNGLLPYSRTVRLVTQKLGRTHAYILHEVVCADKDVLKAGRELELRALREALQVIADRRLAIWGLGEY